jgi:hypothetical protein
MYIYDNLYWLDFLILHKVRVMFVEQTEIKFVENSQGRTLKWIALSGFGYEASGQATTLHIVRSFREDT